MRHSLGSCDTSNISIRSDDLLFYHPSVTVIKFELPQSSSSSPVLPDLDYPVDAIETLPWRTRSETIAAIGVLRIENIAGSAAFLKTGNIVYALLKNCQCWCVDAKSTFVLRIRKLTYYRIEFPNETDEDVKKVEEWKQVLSKIIRYEITPCPFKREFSVELPEEAKTPKKKRAWRPKTMLNLPVRTLDLEGSISSEDRESSESGSASGDKNRPSERSGSSNQHFLRDRRRSSPVRIPQRTSFRAVSEPVPEFETLLARFQSESESGKSASRHGSGSPTSSDSSFHSIIDAPSSPPSPLHLTPPSPQTPVPAHVSHMISKVDHTRDSSVKMIIPETPDGNLSAHQPLTITGPSAGFLTMPDAGHSFFRIRSLNDLEVPIQSSNSALRRRIRATRQRSYSPLPPSSTLSTPTPKSPINKLINSMFEKTYTFVLGPPIHLILMFLRLAAEVTPRDSIDSPAWPRTPSARPEMANGVDDLRRDDYFVNPLSSSISARESGRSSTDSDTSSEVD
ncbi:hypothetical protein PRK78_005654 [Emydomyces testavorans]|uniref:Inheritance of peroxisomes protein 1 n=1 Tax=Emydomyces testavorans TaxID=2070801 RepID=A0AAF0DKY0_9EURO|nr:hypothetical protein PRK78_005654 [Emydomyces testavorans]